MKKAVSATQARHALRQIIFSDGSAQLRRRAVDRRPAAHSHVGARRCERTALGIGPRSTVTVGKWRYAGRGYSPEPALQAASVREVGASRGA
ncbi:hypothetical protein BOG92_043275 [Streptomyces sp. WAC00263]|nr:hypothetical protein BOG92_043275 [Streptomyces sp. WAC00263]